MISALTQHHKKVVDCIKTKVTIKNPYTNEEINTLAIWDTGATNSTITASVAKELGLAPIGRVKCGSAAGAYDCNVYFAEIITHNNEIRVKSRLTEVAELSAACDTGCLIGMNLIGQGSFVISNHNNQTTMSFMVPSTKKIDFVRELNDLNARMRRWRWLGLLFKGK